MSDWGVRLTPKWQRRSEHRAKRFGRQQTYFNRIALFLLGAIVVAAAINSIVDRPVDWTEPCSDFEIRQGTARERFATVHYALTQEEISRPELSKLRQVIWQDLPLCRELVELVSLSLQLYNDLLLVEAASAHSENLPDLGDYERWYELYLGLHRT